MKKIADNFSGYLNVDGDTFVYNVSNHRVTLLPAQSEETERYKVADRIQSHNIDSPEYLFGCDNNYYKIAMLRNSGFSFGFLNPSIIFATPLIIKSLGNAVGFYNAMTTDWDKFHVITFCGGNINALGNPQIAVERQNIHEYLKKDGAREIKVRPWDEYTYSVDFELDGERVTFTLSVLQTGETTSKEHMGAYSLGELNSFIRLSFENVQCFDKIEKYYRIVKSLTAILTKQNNVTFEVYLGQRDSENKILNTAVCKFFDHYENYCTKNSNRVIPLCNIFEYVPNLISKIANKNIDILFELLPEDNRRINQISITNVQDICTALEVAYDWTEREREKDALIKELKKNIKSTISEFVKEHPEIDVNKETTISSSFQYLDYTLKQKILTLYNENRNVIDDVISKWSLPQVNEDSIASFVGLRNKKTHSGIVEWGNNADLYIVLLALVYACLFRYIGLPDERIKCALFQIF